MIIFFGNIWYVDDIWYYYVDMLSSVVDSVYLECLVLVLMLSSGYTAVLAWSGLSPSSHLNDGVV